MASKNSFKHLPPDLDESQDEAIEKGSEEHITHMEEIPSAHLDPQPTRMGMIESTTMDPKERMVDGEDLESKINDQELTSLNSDHIMDECWKREYNAIPMEQLTKVHKVHLNAQEGN